MKHLAALIFLTLTACGREVAPPPVAVPVVVDKAVAVSCVPSNYQREAPEYPDTNEALRAAPDAAVRYQLLWAGRSLRIARERENEAVISGCK